MNRRIRVAMMGAFLAITACTNGPTPPRDRGPDRPPPQGILRLGYPEEPPTLNPIRARSPAARDILRAVLPSFFLITPDLRYEPYLLAEEPDIRVAGNRMEVNFRIRRGARWSDGTPVTVDDVEFTRRVMIDPALPVAIRDGFQFLTRVEERSSKEGALILEPPYAGWRDLFSAGRFVLPAQAAWSPDEVRGWTEGPPVTGGPFTIGRWVRGLSVSLLRDPEFFGRRPLLDGIDVTFVPDPTTAVQLLSAGELDAVAPMLGVAWRRRLEQVEALSISSAYGPDLVNLVINTGTLADPGLRARVADAIDRERFIEVILRDVARRADSVLVNEQDGSVAAWSRFGRGAPTPVATGEITLAYTNNELLHFVAKHIQEELERAGSDVELLGLDADVFQGRFLLRRDYDLAIWEARSAPAPWLDRWFASGGGENASGLADAELDRLLEMASRATEVPALLRAIQERLATLVPVLPLFQPELTMAWRAGVDGLRTNPTVDGPLWNAWDWSKAAADLEAA